jgi:hypothetical protein
MDTHHHRDINNLPPHMGNQVLEATSREGPGETSLVVTNIIK